MKSSEITRNYKIQIWQYASNHDIDGLKSIERDILANQDLPQTKKDILQNIIHEVIDCLLNEYFSREPE